MENAACTRLERWVLDSWERASESRAHLLLDALCSVPSLAWQDLMNRAQSGEPVAHRDLLLDHQDEIYERIAEAVAIEDRSSILGKL